MPHGDDPNVREVTEVVYENQRARRTGWGPPKPAGGVAPFATAAGAPRPGLEGVAPPPGWAWHGNWRVVVVPGATDAEGFAYAYDFEGEPRWYPSPRWNTYVRRRKWVRTRRRLPEATEALTPSALGAESVRPATREEPTIDVTSPTTGRSSGAGEAGEVEGDAAGSPALSRSSSLTPEGAGDDAPEDAFPLDRYLRTGPLLPPTASSSSLDTATSTLSTPVSRASPTFLPLSSTSSQGLRPSADTESVLSDRGRWVTDTDVLETLPSASAEFFRHLRLSEVDRLVANACRLHEAAQFRAAAGQFLLAADLLNALLRRMLQGSMTLQDADGEELSPLVLFPRLQTCTDHLQHEFLRLREEEAAARQQQLEAAAQRPRPALRIVTHPRRALRRGLRAARAKMLPRGGSRWELFVLQHYDWHGTVAAQHQARLRDLEADPENPALAAAHLMWLLTAAGSPLATAVAAFAVQFEGRYGGGRPPGTGPDVEAVRSQLAAARQDVLDFGHALVHYAKDRLFADIDTVTGRAFLSSLVDREVQRCTHPHLMPLYWAVHVARDQQLNDLVEEAVEGAFAAAIPEEHRRDFSAVADTLRRLPLFPNADAKLGCVVDAVREIHACLEQPAPAAEPGAGSAHAVALFEGWHNTGLAVAGPADAAPALSSSAPEADFALPTTADPEAGEGEAPPEAPPETPAGPLGADAMLPIFIYCLLVSRVPNLWSEAEYLQDFIKDSQSRGHYGYCLVTLQSALVYLLQRAGGGPFTSR